MAKKKIEVVEDVIQEVADEVVAEKSVVLDMTLEDFKDKVEIKKNISIYAQKQIVDIVYANCVINDEENGVYYIDEIMQQVALDFAVLEHCTNFYDVIENAQLYTYDYLYEIGVFGYLSDMSKDGQMDIHNACVAITNFNERVASLNSVGSCLHRLVKDFIKKMPDAKSLDKIIKGLPKAINSIDKDVLGALANKSNNGKILKVDNDK